MRWITFLYDGRITNYNLDHISSIGWQASSVEESKKILVHWTGGELTTLTSPEEVESFKAAWRIACETLS